MSNPKVRSLGRRGGQRTNDENGEAKKKEGSYSYRVDDETKDIVKSLFEEYASDDGKNFYSGNKDEKSEKEHEEFISEVDRQLNGDTEEETVSEENVEAGPEVNPLSKLVEETPAKPAEASEDKAAAEAAASGEAPAVKREPVRTRQKRVSVIKTPKKTEEVSAEAPGEEAKEAKAAEEAPKTKAKADKKEKTKSKGKAVSKMRKKNTPKNTPKDEEFYDEYEDGYEEYDDYEDGYSEDYDDDAYEDDDYDDEEEYETKRSGGGVEFSLKIVALTIILVIVLLIMTALFINNRSLSAELKETQENYDQMLNQYTSEVEQLNAKISELTNPQTETADTSAAGEADAASSDDSSAESGEETYYVVQSGDTLYKIASSQLGDPNLYYLIQEANNMGSKTTLSVGDKLIIPNVEE